MVDIVRRQDVIERKRTTSRDGGADLDVTRLRANRREEVVTLVLFGHKRLRTSEQLNRVARIALGIDVDAVFRLLNRRDERYLPFDCFAHNLDIYACSAEHGGGYYFALAGATEVIIHTEDDVLAADIRGGCAAALLTCALQAVQNGLRLPLV